MEDFKKLICRCHSNLFFLEYIFDKEFRVICSNCGEIHLGMRNRKICWKEGWEESDNF